MAHYRITRIEDYEQFIGSESVERIREKAGKLKGLRVANFNSTYYGGGAPVRRAPGCRPVPRDRTTSGIEKHQGRRFPAASITQAFSIRRLCASGCLAESIQLIKSLRSIGVRSLH
jgi:hypothetical protein